MVEKRLRDVQPDIVLSRNGAVIAAIEVFSKHAVDDVKRQKFQNSKIFWIEVKAKGNSVDARFTTDSDDGVRWTIEKPLQWYKMQPLLPQWNCDYCANL